MKELDDLEQIVAAQMSVISGTTALLNGLHEVLVNIGDDPEKIKIFTEALGSKKDRLGAALVLNTPALGL